MIFRSPQNPNSHLTVKKRRWPSFPTKQLFLKNLIDGRVLDFGCGLGIDVKFLENNGIDATGYDPYYKPEYPQEKFDTILCNYVLNILLPEEQAHVLMAVSELLKPGGKAYYTVRRDIKRSGFRFNPKHQCETYQCNVILHYKSIILTEHCEVYEYCHINQTKKHQNEDACLFCCPDVDTQIVTESATAYTMLKKAPCTKGHSLVIPKKHCNVYFELTFREQSACWLMVNRVKKILEKEYHPKGFKIEVISEKNKKQVSNHTHINLIPIF